MSSRNRESQGGARNHLTKSLFHCCCTKLPKRVHIRTIYKQDFETSVTKSCQEQSHTISQETKPFHIFPLIGEIPEAQKRPECRCGVEAGKRSCRVIFRCLRVPMPWDFRWEHTPKNIFRWSNARSGKQRVSASNSG